MVRFFHQGDLFEEALQVISTKLHNYDALAERFCLAGRSHYVTGGGLSENHTFSFGGYVLTVEKWHGYEELSIANC
jgi:hypothetical protein